MNPIKNTLKFFTSVWSIIELEKICQLRCQSEFNNYQLYMLVYASLDHIITKFRRMGVPTRDSFLSRVLKVGNLSQVEAQYWKPKIVFSQSTNTSPVQTRSNIRIPSFFSSSEAGSSYSPKFDNNKQQSSVPFSELTHNVPVVTGGVLISWMGKLARKVTLTMATYNAPQREPVLTRAAAILCL